MRTNGKVTVLFLDGVAERHWLNLVPGAAMAGWPTAYVMRAGKLVWVKPGISAQFVEVVPSW